MKCTAMLKQSANAAATALLTLPRCRAAGSGSRLSLSAPRPTPKPPEQAVPVESRKAVASVASIMSAGYADRMVCTKCGCQSGCLLRPFLLSLWQLGRS